MFVLVFFLYNIVICVLLCLVVFDEGVCLWIGECILGIFFFRGLYIFILLYISILLFYIVYY